MITKVGVAVGRVLAGIGVRQVFGVVGSGNFHVTNALIDEGAGFVAARHENGAATMADAYARTSGRVARGIGAPGLRTHERDDGNHRGGQEPHPDDRDRRRGERPAVELLRRSTGSRRSSRCGVDARDLCRRRSRNDHRRVHHGRRRPAHRAVEPAARRAGRGPRGRVVVPDLDRRSRARPRFGAGRCAGVGVVVRAAPGIRRRSGRSLTRRPRRAPGTRRPHRRAARDERSREGAVPRRPVVARCLRWVRHSPGGRADPRRGRDRRLGLRPEHVDDAARRPDRTRCDGGAGRRRAGGARAASRDRCRHRR